MHKIIRLGLIFLLTMIFFSCKYMSKDVKSIEFDIAFFSQNELCISGKLPEKVKGILKPFMSNDLILKPQGKIYQLANESVIFIEISDSNYNSLTNLRKKMFSGKDTYDATIANYNSMIDDISTTKLCNTNVSTKVAENLNALLASNSNSKVIVLSTTILDTVWNNYKVFKEVSKLKDYVISLTKGEGSEKVLILIEPEQKTPTPPEVKPAEQGDTSKVINPPGPVFGVEGIRQALLNITKIEDPVKRRNFANKLFIDSFTNQVYIKMYKDSITSEPEIYDYNDGKNYLLKRLTSEESIKDLKILKIPERSNTDSKISHLVLMEIHKH